MLYWKDNNPNCCNNESQFYKLTCCQSSYQKISHKFYGSLKWASERKVNWTVWCFGPTMRAWLSYRELRNLPILTKAKQISTNTTIIIIISAHLVVPKKRWNTVVIYLKNDNQLSFNTASPNLFHKGGPQSTFPEWCHQLLNEMFWSI